MTMQRTIIALTLAGLLAAVAAPAIAQEHAPQPPRQKWSFSGPFGKFDQAQLQRGFKIYREVCASCHSVEMLAFRNLADAGDNEDPEELPVERPERRRAHPRGVEPRHEHQDGDRPKQRDHAE